MNTEYKALIDHIVGQHKGQAVLNRQQTAKFPSIGVYTLDLRISQGREILLTALKWEMRRIPISLHTSFKKRIKMRS